MYARVDSQVVGLGSRDREDTDSYVWRRYADGQCTSQRLLARPSSKWPKRKTITQYKQLVPKQRLPRKNQGVCGKEPLFLCNRVSKVFFYKVGCSP